MVITDENLKQLITQKGLVDAKKLEELVRLAHENKSPLQNVLVEQDIISDANLGLLIADFFKLPFVILSKTFISDEVFHIIPESVARKYKVIPFARDKESVKIAMQDPSDGEIQRVIAKKTGSKVIPYFATERDISNAFRIYKKDVQKTINELINAQGIGTKLHKTNEAPIAQIVDIIINDAYQDKASDIHIEAIEDASLVRFRIDGVLHDTVRLPKNIHEQIIARIKVLSKLRTDEHLSAQDGKMRINVTDENLDIRVSIIPIAEGEKVVLRLLASQSRRFTLIDLGMGEKDLRKVEGVMNKSFGMILATGPTGSGKTSTIYAILKILNTRDRNITTIEDPVEYRIRGVNQIQANPKTNLTFANGLRSILRQDPNIIFVGEIRDNETAGIAVNAALTGHLVLSTLHTNNAATALPRLIDMKVEPFLVGSTVNIIIAQRLLRRICEMCNSSLTVDQNDLVGKIPLEIMKKLFGNKSEIQLYKGKGCKICRFTGYSERIAVFEVLEITNKIRKLITEKNDADMIAQEASTEGMTTMLDDGLEKVKKGITTLEEVLRVTRADV